MQHHRTSRVLVAAQHTSAPKSLHGLVHEVAQRRADLRTCCIVCVKPSWRSQDMGRICRSRKGGVPAGVAPGYRQHLGPKDSTMVKETEKRWQKMHGKKGVRQYDTAAAAAFVGTRSDEMRLYSLPPAT